jgi:hypothetical protein
MNRNFIMIYITVILLIFSDSLHACRRYCNSGEKEAPSLAPEPPEDESNAIRVTSFTQSASTQSISPEIFLATIKARSRSQRSPNSLSISSLSADSTVLEELFSSCESLDAPESSS